MIDVSGVSDFNLHFVSQYSSRSFLAAGRFFDLTKDWERLCCEWYGRHGFGEQKNDRYIGQVNGRDAIRYRSIDALVEENPKELSPIGQHLYDTWLGVKADLAKTRSEPPPVVVLPPPETPPEIPTKKDEDDAYRPHPNMPKPPKATPVDLPPKEEEPKKPRAEWRVRLGVYLMLLTPVASVVSYFLPPPWNGLASIVLEALKLLNGG